jgi:hypothetical protein
MMIGSGTVPLTVLSYRNVRPLPAAMFATRFPCAFRNSSTKPFSTMLISFRSVWNQSCFDRCAAYRISNAMSFVSSR